MPAMRIAIAGTCGLALQIAHQIQTTTSHSLVILSRREQTVLLSQGYQCQIVDYNSPPSLQHALMGIDTVISTVTGTPQLRLIEAAVRCRVRRFAPAEFEGQPSLRAPDDVHDRGRSAALALLQYYKNNIQHAVFVCGILYERFSVNGLASHNMGLATGFSSEGDYIANPRAMTATAPVWDAAHNLTSVCLTSLYDVARFVVRALELPRWEGELSMCGERVTVSALVGTIRACRNKQWTRIENLDAANLSYRLSLAHTAQDTPAINRLAPLVATAEGRHAFTTPAYLNTVFPDVRPVAFAQWFAVNWAGVV